jgi:acetyltransferase-like isoleucine patch superfamily enzyme
MMVFNYINDNFNNFYLPNYRFITSGRLRYVKTPCCGQLTLLTGKGTIEIGSNCAFGFKLGGFHRAGSIELQARYKNSRIKIGNNVNTNNNIFLCAANYIEIGDNTLIGQNVTIMDHEAHGILPNDRREVGVIGKVITGKNVWLGNNVTILKNSEIGDNTVVATGAVVSGSFPANVIIGGVPAKIIKVIE